MYIKVLKCSNNEYWYRPHIGKVFDVKFYDESSSSYVVDNIDGTHNVMGSIFDGDYEEISNFSKEDLFVPPPKKKTEEQLLREELEMTQLVLNEILMKGGDL